MDEKKSIARAVEEMLLEFEEKHPGVTATAPGGALESYARLRKDLAYFLWAREAEAAQYLCQKASGPEGLLIRMGDEALLLCAATIRGLQEDRPEFVPDLAQREAALAGLEECVSDEEGKYTRKYRQICQSILTLPERPPQSDGDRLRALKAGVDAFLAVYQRGMEREEAPYLTDREREAYVALARPVMEALREGNQAVARYVTFSLAPDADPFLLARDFWLKSAAAALWGIGQAEKHPDRAMAMMAMIDFYMAYGGAEDMDHEGSIPWTWLGGYPKSSYGEGEERIEFGDWWDVAWHNVMRRLNHFLDFDYVNQFWYRDDFEDLGHIWMDKGIL